MENKNEHNAGERLSPAAIAAGVEKNYVKGYPFAIGEVGSMEYFKSAAQANDWVEKYKKYLTPKEQL